jgi:DNA ligase (NAD+)
MAQRNALDIEGIGSVVAEKLIESGLIKEWLDVFELKAGQLAELNLGTKEEPRIFGEKNATKVCAAVERAKTFSLARWLLALGIEAAGETISYEVAKFHCDLEHVANSEALRGIAKLGSLCDRRDAASPNSAENKQKSEEQKATLKQERDRLNREILALGEDLEKQGVVERSKIAAEGKGRPKFLPIVGPKVAKNIVEYFDSEAGRQVLGRLRKLKINPPGSLANNKKSPTVADSPFNGKTFVLTGSLASMTRDKAAEEIRARGGSVGSAISKNTDFLVAGESAGSKMEKARELHVQIINEEQFSQMLGGKGESAEATTRTAKQKSLI